MRKRFLAILAGFVMIFGVLVVAPAPAYAACAAGDKACECKENNTSILKFDCDKDGIFAILDLVLTILTYGVGVLAIGAVVFAGIRYASAGGSEENTRKAKKMIFDTVIGLLCYAVLWTVLRWLFVGW
ncbi:MAG: hypothetical protein LBQ02_02135 [Candidatus Nomurabacteria bacterium]|jgi:hypothetical protein|nr:hypothetical protein [Candidatus Nomurabacteria bacterium]